MLPPNTSRDALRKMFRRKRIATLIDLFQVLNTRSRMSVFRRLKDSGYMTSFTHSGRYYTMPEIPKFDHWGLWFHQGVGFSREGTLKTTVVKLVESSEAGMTPRQMLNVLRLRVSNTLHNTLHELIKIHNLDRQRQAGISLYVSAEPGRAAEQVAARTELAASLAEMLRVATDEEVVEVLVEALRAAPAIPAPAIVAGRLVARGVRLEPHHVEQVYEEHGLVPGKKTQRPSSRPSRR